MDLERLGVKSQQIIDQQWAEADGLVGEIERLFEIGPSSLADFAVMKKCLGIVITNVYHRRGAAAVEAIAIANERKG